jgi:MFS family permease
MRPQWYRTLDCDARRAFWSSFAGFSLDAMDIQLYAFVLPVLLALWGLSHAEAGLLATVALVSSAAGGWIGGLLADRFGRVRLLRITILWFAVSTCLCGLATDFNHLLVARALQGLGFGAEVAVTAVFIAEVAAPRLRGRMVGMVQSGWAVGWGLAAAISTIVLSLFPPGLGWRVIFVVGLLPAILIFVFRGRLKEPEAFLRSTRRAPWHAIFSGPIRIHTVMGSVLATGVHGGYWAIATWWPVMLSSELGLSILDSGPYLAALIGGSFCGYVVGSWLGDIVGRRATLAVFALGGIVLALAYSELAVSATTLLLMSLPIGFVATGMFSVIGSLLSELYPTELRGSGLGFCYNFGRGMAGVGAALIGASAERVGVGHALGLFVACAYGLVLLAALMLPETRERELRSLSEIAP